MKTMMHDSAVELVESQNEIIRLQSEAIDELFRLLSQHISAMELDKLEVINTIDQAAQIRAELNL